MANYTILSTSTHNNQGTSVGSLYINKHTPSDDYLTVKSKYNVTGLVKNNAIRVSGDIHHDVSVTANPNESVTWRNPGPYPWAANISRSGDRIYIDALYSAEDLGVTNGSSVFLFTLHVDVTCNGVTKTRSVGIYTEPVGGVQLTKQTEVNLSGGQISSIYYRINDGAWTYWGSNPNIVASDSVDFKAFFNIPSGSYHVPCRIEFLENGVMQNYSSMTLYNDHTLYLHNVTGINGSSSNVVKFILGEGNPW